MSAPGRCHLDMSEARDRTGSEPDFVGRFIIFADLPMVRTDRRLRSGAGEPDSQLFFFEEQLEQASEAGPHLASAHRLQAGKAARASVRRGSRPALEATAWLRTAPVSPRRRLLDPPVQLPTDSLVRSNPVQSRTAACMLARAAFAACRCASTSTAAPCRHGVRASSRHLAAEATSPEPELPRGREGGAALDYAAPLWATEANPQWFHAARPAWTDWKRNHTAVPATHASLSRVSSTPPPSPSETRPPTGPSPSEPSRSASLPDSAAARVSTYLRTRGRRTALDGFRDEYGQLLQVAERAEMPLLQAMVLEDQELAEASHRTLKLLEMERFATNRPKDGGQVAHAVRTGSDRGRITVDLPPASTAGRRRRARSSAAHVAPADPREDRLIRPTEDAASRLVAYAAGEAFNLSVASRDWEAFSLAADFESSDDDLHIAINLLLRLSQPVPNPALDGSSPPPSSPELPLALQVLQSLLDVYPEDVVRPEPTGVQLPHSVRLQVVLLRTVLEIALREELSTVSHKALHALGELRVTHAVLADSPESAFDTAALDHVLQRGIVRLREDRQTSYAPVMRLEAWSRSSEISRLGALLRLRYKWTVRFPSDRSESVSWASARLVSDFFDECATRHRWDLAAECWRLWSKRGWSIGRRAVRLAAWLAGDSAPDTYGPGVLSASAVHPALFSRLAHETSLALEGERTAAGWTTEDKNDWVDLLCTSRGASRATRQLARRLVAHWQQVQPVASATPFVLRGSTLLNLLRTALPPYGTDYAYPRQLLAVHIATLVNPVSPYASADGHIEHFDLTTLAQAFTLAGDHASVGQIYRRALEQKHLPDSKDVGVVLADVARRFPQGALEQVARAAASGLKIDLELLQAVLKAQLEACRADPSLVGGGDSRGARQREAVTGACALAARLGFTAPRVAALRRFGEHYLAADVTSTTKPFRRDPGADMSVARAVGDLVKAARANDWRLAHRVFMRTLVRDGSGRAVAHGIREERVLTLCLDTLLKADRSKGYRADRLAIRDAIAQVLDAAVAPLARLEAGEAPTAVGNVTLIQSRAGLDLVLKAYIRTAEPEAVNALMAVLERQADLQCSEILAPSDTVKEKVVRWAVARTGRAVLLGQRSYLGTAANDILATPTIAEISESQSESRSSHA